MAEIDWGAVLAEANALSSNPAAQQAFVNSVSPPAVSTAPPPPPTPPATPPVASPVATASARTGVTSSGVPSAVLPSGLPAGMLATPVTLASPGSTPVAQGVDLFQQMLDNIFTAERLRQSNQAELNNMAQFSASLSQQAAGQQAQAAQAAAALAESSRQFDINMLFQKTGQAIDLSQLFASLQRSSPSQAANLAVGLGLPGLEPNLGYANAFTGPRTTGTFGGKVGSQDIKLPFAFSGRELSFLGNNPNVAAGISDIAGALGRPDFLKNSVDALIPTGGNLFKF